MYYITLDTCWPQNSLVAWLVAQRTKTVFPESGKGLAQSRAWISSTSAQIDLDDYVVDSGSSPPWTPWRRLY